MGREEGEILGVIIVVVTVLAAAIYISRALFPWFVALSAISLIILIIMLIFTLFGDLDGELLIWPGGALAIFLIGTAITFGIGYGFGDSSMGQAVLALDKAFGIYQDAEQQVTVTTIDALKNATSDVVTASNTSDSEHIAEVSNASLDLLKVRAQLP